MSDPQAPYKTTPAPNLRMLSPAELVAGLRGLAEHRDAGALSLMEASLLREAANYVAGATDSLREHMAMIRALRVELAETRGQRDGLREVLGNE